MLALYRKINHLPVKTCEQNDVFAEFFSKKVKDIVNECKIDKNVYNGKWKYTCNDSNFMTPNNILKAVKSLKLKNCEGFDRIPVRFIIDGIFKITPVLTHCSISFIKPNLYLNNGVLVKLSQSWKREIRTKSKIIGQLQTSVQLQRSSKN